MCRLFSLSLIGGWLAHTPVHHETDSAGRAGVAAWLVVVVHFARYTIFAAVNILRKLPLSSKTRREGRETDGRHDSSPWEATCAARAGYFHKRGRRKLRKEEKKNLPAMK